MKTITEQYLHTLEDSILKEKKKAEEKLGQTFRGVSSEELYKEIEVRVGGRWMVKKEDVVKFSRGDINAVASYRFFKGTGRTTIMVLAILVLGLSVVVKYLPMTALYYNIYYALCGLIALIFIYVYSRKQSKVRKELWQQLGREEEKEEGK